MNNLGPKKIGLGVTAVIIIAALAATFYYAGEFETKFNQITWQKQGGIAGINEELIIDSDGTLTFSSNILNDVQDQLSENELNNLIDLINETKIFSENNKSYTARNGVADFFSYSLTITLNGEKKVVTWVDDWASEETLPQTLKDIQSHIENIIETINQ